MERTSRTTATQVMAQDGTALATTIVSHRPSNLGATQMPDPQFDWCCQTAATPERTQSGARPERCQARIRCSGAICPRKGQIREPRMTPFATTTVSARASRVWLGAEEASVAIMVYAWSTRAISRRPRRQPCRLRCPRHPCRRSLPAQHPFRRLLLLSYPAASHTCGHRATRYRRAVKQTRPLSPPPGVRFHRCPMTRVWTSVGSLEKGPMEGPTMTGSDTMEY